MRKSIAVLLILLLCLYTGCVMAEDGPNLLANPGFEELTGSGTPVGWSTDAYYSQEGYTLFTVADDDETHGNYAVITGLADNDARFRQTVRVEPESLYRLSGWIRADVTDEAGRGANLSIEGLYAFSESVYNTNGEWKHIEYYGETGEDQKELTVFVRLGGYGGESRGKAAFDDVSLCKVDKLPSAVVADVWYSVPVEPVRQDSSDTTVAAPFWPWLIVLSVLFVIGIAVMLPQTFSQRRELTPVKRPPVIMWIGLAIAAIVRIIIAMNVEGYGVDVGCFTAWGGTMASVGPVDFYASTGFCDYPPAYVYVLGLCSIVFNAIKALPAAFVFKIIPMLCDILAAWMIYRTAVERKLSANCAAAIAMVTAFNPAIIINSAAWCQMDAVLCLGLMLVVMLAEDKKWRWVMPVYMLCVLIKPQALMVGPLGLTAIVMEWLRDKAKRRDMLIGVALAVAAAVLILIPFSLHQPLDWLIQLYSRTLMSYPYATVNTANFYYLFGANWASVEASAVPFAAMMLSLLCILWSVFCIRHRGGKRLPYLEPVIMLVFAAAFWMTTILQASWGVVGAMAMALAFAVTLPMYIRAGKTEHLPLLGSVLFILLYVFGVKMHERYLFPALFMLGLAFAVRRDWRILLTLVLMSVTVFINEGIVLDNAIRLGASLGHLNNDTVILADVLAIINVGAAVFTVWTAWDITVEESPEKLLAPIHRKQSAASENDNTMVSVPHGCDPLHYRPDCKLHWTKTDTILMVSVTLVYAVVALWNLGSTKAPQKPWKSSTYEETVTIDLGQEYDRFNMLYFAQVSYRDFSMETSSDGENWSEEHWLEMAEGQCYRWKYAAQYQQNDDRRTYNSRSPQVFSGRYVRINAKQIGLILCEVIFRDADGQVIPAHVISHTGENTESPLYSDPAALLDEQDTLEGEPSWYNSTYFDEIYYARTGYEFLTGTRPYETTHPPLGKVLMMLCISIFGMTPFGWRFAGAFAGILMLPAMYLTGKQMTKRTDAAMIAMSMMALDCMHLTQTRICTIDSFPVLFIILCYFFMLRFMQRDILLDSMKELLPDLALSGFFMGLAIASKWIGLYAGVGLAVLYFWTCARHILLAQKARKKLAISSGLTADEKKLLKQRAGDPWNRIILLCLWCVLLFVVVPAIIYLLSYIPYYAYAHFSNPLDFINNVITAQVNMLNYHATPGLGMDHPFYSPWYDWPLIKKPMFYATAEIVPPGYSMAIFSFGNPAVWYVGLVGILALFALWMKRHMSGSLHSGLSLHAESSSSDVSPAFLLIGLCSQFLPWVLVPRGTYIYHYFASIPFLCLATALMIGLVSKRSRKAGTIITAVYLAFCLVCFIGFYPYASGVLTPRPWLDFMKQFLHIYY